MKLRKWFDSHLESLWYDPIPTWGVRCFSFFFLQGLSAFYRWGAFLHQKVGLRLSPSLDNKIPVIVVGNLTVGGTGKTPMIVALAEYLKQGGYRPGIVSRGYGGKAKRYPLEVTMETSPAEAGDEPVLLVRRTAVPVVVSPNRVEAVRFLLKQSNCNIILSDDGLQHWRMKRDIEILVIDGRRRFGNGYCLPAGPLREPMTRYKTVDFLVTNEAYEKRKGEYAFHIQPEGFVHLGTGNVYPLDFFKDQKVHLMTAIGHPNRFVETIKKLKMHHDVRTFPDHYAFVHQDFTSTDDLPIIMTEKDAVKCEKFEEALKNKLFYLKISAKLDPLFKEVFMKKLNQVSLRLDGEKLI